MDDYAAGLKGPKTGTAAAAGTTLFGSAIAQPASSSGFGGFGATTTTSTTGFGGM